MDSVEAAMLSGWPEPGDRPPFDLTAADDDDDVKDDVEPWYP